MSLFKDVLSSNRCCYDVAVDTDRVPIGCGKMTECSRIGRNLVADSRQADHETAIFCPFGL